MIVLLFISSFISCGYATQKGMASFYSDYYEGKTTANGEIFRHK